MRPEMFYRKAALGNLEIVRGKHLKVEFSEVGSLIAPDDCFFLFKFNISDLSDNLSSTQNYMLCYFFFPVLYDFNL